MSGKRDRDRERWQRRELIRRCREVEGAKLYQLEFDTYSLRNTRSIAELVRLLQSVVGDLKDMQSRGVVIMERLDVGSSGASIYVLGTDDPQVAREYGFEEVKEEEEEDDPDIDLDFNDGDY
jgi:hypothetical protein